MKPIDHARRAAAGAVGVALATTGLSSCNNNGAVDPAPPPLECNTVNSGQSLSASATRSADTVRVVVRNTHPFAAWRVTRVGDVSGGTLLSAAIPPTVSRDSLVLTIQLRSDTTSQVSFTVEAELLNGSVCQVTRTFVVTLSGGGVTVGVVNLDGLPLAARQRAVIVVVEQAGHEMVLEARTPYGGSYQIEWTTTAGRLDGANGRRARWSLPAEPGVYQAELVLDFGPDGLAVDTVLFEVS